LVSTLNQPKFPEKNENIGGDVGGRSNGLVCFLVSLKK